MLTAIKTVPFANAVWAGKINLFERGKTAKIMNSQQWNIIKDCAAMKPLGKVPVALIVDSPWIPGYTGITTLDYFTSPEIWLKANLKVIHDFPDIIFLPGFWVEYGMATEPSGFGCKISFYENNLPHVYPAINSVDEISKLYIPNPKTDGLMPFVLNIYKQIKDRVSQEGHLIKVVASRGPFTIASHVMGLTNFLVNIKIEPESTHKILKLITEFIIIWLEAQMDVLKEVEGIMILDDVAGFISRDDFIEFAYPYFKKIFSTYSNFVKIYHNDTDNPVPYEFLGELGVNIFNFTHLRNISDVRKIVGDKVCLMGNVPPLHVLAEGNADLVKEKAMECIKDNGNMPGFILSAGGGTSPKTPGENIAALCSAAELFSRDINGSK